LGATTIPVWFEHPRLLPFHFGAIALCSTAAALELLGFRIAALNVIGLAASAVETGTGAWIEITSLIVRLVGWRPVAVACFLIGEIFSRYGRLRAGLAASRDPEVRFATQQVAPLGT
jgi:hypothetical protein